MLAEYFKICLSGDS